MSKTVNFNDRQIISKHELIDWDYSLRELIGKFIHFGSRNNGVGIVDTMTDYGSLEHDSFRVSMGSVPSGGFDTIKVGRGVGLLDITNVAYSPVAGIVMENESLKNTHMAIFTYDETDNIDARIGDYSNGSQVAVGFIPVIDPREVGVCAVSGSGQVVITGGNFKGLRGHNFSNPSRIRFYTELGGVANNNDIYEVIEVVSDNEIIIAGNPIAETNIRYMIVGSYDLKVYGNLSDKSAYTHIRGELTFSLNSEDITNAGGFVISQLNIGAGGSFTVVDLRTENLYQLSLPADVVFKSQTQTITGQKTFGENAPRFNVPTIQIPDSVTYGIPLVITNTGTGILDSYLNIPANVSGAIITVRGDSTHKDCASIRFDAGYAPGTKFYLRVSESGTDIDFYYVPGFFRTIYPNNLTLASAIGIGTVPGYKFTVKAGAIMELWADEGYMWHVLNANPMAI